MLKIHGVPISVHTRKVIVAALAKGLPHEVIPVVPVIPGNPPPNWRELSPTGKIPAITDGDFTLADSAAICAYLERLHPAPPLYPRRARLRAGAVARAVRGHAVPRRGAPAVPRGVRASEDPQHPHRPRRSTRCWQAVPEVFGYLDARLPARASSPERACRWPTSRWPPTWSPTSTSASSWIATRYPRLAALFERVLAHPGDARGAAARAGRWWSRWGCAAISSTPWLA